MAVFVLKAEGEKCIRCWNRRVTVGKYSEFPELCERCYKVVTS